jgi:hypothetical protein
MSSNQHNGHVSQEGRIITPASETAKSQGFLMNTSKEMTS